MQALTGKVVLVTGGSRGLGAATAEALADQGADVAISYVASVQKAQAVVAMLRAKGVRAMAIRCDQADTSLAKPLVDEVIAHFGRLDILVNNAAIAVHGQRVDDADLDTIALDRQWQVNVLGVVAVTRAAAPLLSEGGRIIFIGALPANVTAVAGTADHAGTKAAIVGYAKGVARDLVERNITVNVIAPGVMPTDMAARMLGVDGPDAILDLHTIRRIATVQEVSSLVCCLAGPDGCHVTGGVFDVAGGLVI